MMNSLQLILDPQAQRRVWNSETAKVNMAILQQLSNVILQSMNVLLKLVLHGNNKSGYMILITHLPC
jgi:hypothetical protein